MRLQRVLLVKLGITAFVLINNNALTYYFFNNKHIKLYLIFHIIWENLMGKFLTYKAELRQSDEENKWYTKHNQLFFDDDERIFLVPRNYLTDGYTIPNGLAWLGGGKMQWDIRPAIGHDYECQYHSEIVVNLSEQELRAKGYLKEKNKYGTTITICENIPPQYLEVRPTTFKKANDKFERMMDSVGSINSKRIKLLRFGVNFNLGWLKTGKKQIDLNNLYKQPQKTLSNF